MKENQHQQIMGIIPEKGNNSNHCNKKEYEYCTTHYGVFGITDNFLINPERKIVARNLKGDVLNKKLKEIFTTQNP